MRPELTWTIDDEPRSPLAPTPEPAPVTPRRGWRLLAIASLVAVVCAAGGFWLRAQQLEEPERDEVLRVARLEDQLATRGEFEALQDSTFPGWRTWQALAPRAGLTGLDGAPSERNVHGRLYWGYSGANIYTLVDSEYGRPVLDGDRAVVTVTRTFEREAADDVSAVTFSLRLTQHYLLVRGGWMRTGPSGPQVTQMRATGFGRLETLFPQADAAVMESLLPRLAALADLACADLGCDSGWPRVVFSATPLDLAAQQGQPPEADVLYVPAPLLIGEPLDDEAEEALVRFYGARLVAAIAARSPVGGSGPLWHWLHWELADLGVEAPLPMAALRATARAALVDDVDVLLDPRYRSGATWLALDFLAEHGEGPPLLGAEGDDRMQLIALWLSLQTRAEPLAWRQYLEQIADLPPARKSHPEMAAVCNG